MKKRKLLYCVFIIIAFLALFYVLSYTSNSIHAVGVCAIKYNTISNSIDSKRSIVHMAYEYCSCFKSSVVSSDGSYVACRVKCVAGNRINFLLHVIDTSSMSIVRTVDSCNGLFWFIGNTELAWCESSQDKNDIGSIRIAVNKLDLNTMNTDKLIVDCLMHSGDADMANRAIQGMSCFEDYLIPLIQSNDGIKIAYIDYSTSNLIVHDVVTQRKYTNIVDSSMLARSSCVDIKFSPNSDFITCQFQTYRSGALCNILSVYQQGIGTILRHESRLIMKDDEPYSKYSNLSLVNDNTYDCIAYSSNIDEIKCGLPVFSDATSIVLLKGTVVSLNSIRRGMLDGKATIDVSSIIQKRESCTLRLNVEYHAEHNAIVAIAQFERTEGFRSERLFCEDVYLFKYFFCTNDGTVVPVSCVKTQKSIDYAYHPNYRYTVSANRECLVLQRLLINNSIIDFLWKYAHQYGMSYAGKHSYDVLCFSPFIELSPERYSIESYGIHSSSLLYGRTYFVFCDDGRSLIAKKYILSKCSTVRFMMSLVIVLWFMLLYIVFSLFNLRSL